MGKKYKKPPVVEALCEFQFIPNQQWDLTIPGLIYESLKDKFPDRQQQMGIGVQFRPTEKGIEHKVEPAPPRIQFHKRDKTALVQVAPDLLVINQLRPYPTWSKFKPMILETLQMYRRIANPKGFKRIGLRYINRINIEAEFAELSDYFNFYPQIPERLPQFHTGFILRVEIPYVKDRDRMLITIASTSSEKPDILSFVLDIDYVMILSEAISMEETKEWIEQAHTNIEVVFESCISDKSKTLFGEIK